MWEASLVSRRSPNTAQAGANASSCRSDLFVSRARDSFFKIDQARACKRGMSVGIDKAGKYHIVGAVDFFSASRQFMLDDLVRGSDRRDFAVDA